MKASLMASCLETFPNVTSARHILFWLFFTRFSILRMLRINVYRVPVFADITDSSCTPTFKNLVDWNLDVWVASVVDHHDEWMTVRFCKCVGLFVKFKGGHFGYIVYISNKFATQGIISLLLLLLLYYCCCRRRRRRRRRCCCNKEMVSP